MSFHLLLFIKRLHRSNILKTIGELNMDDCMTCLGQGLVRVIWNGEPQIITCPDCGGMGEHEEEL